jgi:hypothetical protein
MNNYQVFKENALPSISELKIIAFWDVAPCSLVEVDRRFNEITRRYIPEGSNLPTRRRENLKS